MFVYQQIYAHRGIEEKDAAVCYAMLCYPVPTPLDLPEVSIVRGPDSQKGE
jgi:hypothetical protein